MLFVLSSSLGLQSGNSAGTPFSIAPANTAETAGAQIVNRSSVAALAFLVWDILLTFDDEVKVIWPNPWTGMKFLFFFIRYFPVLVQISCLFMGTELSAKIAFTVHDCFIWQIYQGVAVLAIAMACDLILILRVHALYYGHSYIRAFLGLLYFANISCIAIGLALGLPDIKYDSNCAGTYSPPILLMSGIAPLLFQSVLFALTGWKFIHAIRSGWGDVKLVLVLMRDGTWAFVLLFLLILGEAGLVGLGAKAYSGVLYSWLITAFSFCGYRILLNINHLSRPPRNNTSISRHTNTIIQFTTQFSSSFGGTGPTSRAEDDLFWSQSSVASPSTCSPEELAQRRSNALMHSHSGIESVERS